MAINWTDAQIEEIIKKVVAEIGGAPKASAPEYSSEGYNGRKFIGIFDDMNDAIEAANAGYKAIRLNVCQSNAAAIRIFLKNGFKKKASVKTDIGNGFFTDDFIMEKKIM